MALALQVLLSGSFVALTMAGPRCQENTCNWNLWGHYTAKGCERRGADCCPSWFSCPEVKTSPSQCFYKGNVYSVGDPVTVDDPCSTQCTCRVHGSNAFATVECVTIECPSAFRGRPAEGCRRLYKEGDCCSYSQDCDPSNLRSESTCEWGGKTYSEGDQMSFTDYPCQTCVCGAEFTNPTGPGCHKIDCGFEYRYLSELSRGCTPIYFEEDRCCPIDWLCPDDSRLGPAPHPSNINQNNQGGKCYIGSRPVERSMTLDLGDCKLACGCRTPPDLTCIKYRSCELAKEKNYFG